MRGRLVTTGGLAAAALLSIGGVVAVQAGPAALPSNCSENASDLVTCTYAYTGSEQSFTVPAGITSVSVDVIGAQGGSDNDGDAGGRGAEVKGVLSVVGGQLLYVEVGQHPDTAGTGFGATPTAFGGGGAPGYGGVAGGGGGASDIRTLNMGDANTLASRLVVAGGGGGAGENYNGTVYRPGDAGAPGAPASPAAGSAQGGGAGTSTGGGSAGAAGDDIAAAGSPGGRGAGGAGGSGFPSGGGGGGGLYGGGGAGGGGFDGDTEEHDEASGGGGSSLAPAGTTLRGTTSAAASVTISYSLAVAPTVTTNPTGQTVTAGQTATFTAGASGDPTPTVQWQSSTDGGTTFANIAANGTGDSYTTPPATTGSNGTEYRAVFTSSAGSATTTAATLTVDAGPTVTTNPSSETVNSGQTATFTAAASGNPTPTVQWQVEAAGASGFTNIPGATSTSYSFSTDAVNDGSQFRAVFTNSTGSATTSAATLTVNSAPTVTTNPQSQTVGAGSMATFTAAASGNPTATVQWQSSTDGGTSFTNVAGATSDSYTTPATTLGSNGVEYRAVFTNSVGSATTTAATLTVDAGPTVTTNPSSETVSGGQTATFTAAASGNPTPTVQWQVEETGATTYQDISGATSDTYSFTASTEDDGNQYRAVFTNSEGSATTAAATLTVDYAPSVSTNPQDQTVPAGQTATFSASAVGEPAPSVQWQVETSGASAFTDISGATSDTYAFSTDAVNDGSQYRAVFTSSVGSATTTAATLTVDDAPAVTTQPQDQTVTSGHTATFTAAASGNPTPTVQWQVEAAGSSAFTDISGATSDTYSFSTDAVNDGSQYRAVFTNSVDTATSDAATLTVQTPPAFETASSLPAGTVGTAYSTDIDDSGTPAPSDTVVGGSLPPGLSLSGDPTLAGTPTAAGTFTFTLRATNAAGNSDRTFTVDIAAAPVVTPPAAPPAPVVTPPSGPTLPFTGLDATGLGGLGFLAVVGGAALRTAGRRRRHGRGQRHHS